MPNSRDVRPDAVAIYIRWSTEEQGEGTTLDVQLERCSHYIRSQGWQVSQGLIFVDEGLSGASMSRPGLARLREAVQVGLVDCLVTYKLDRLSRNLADTVALIRQEWAGKCVYRSATEGFDTSDDSPVGGLLFNILASFAEFERGVIRDRTWAGLLRRVQQGMYVSGTVPFGYDRAGKGALRLNPEQAKVIARIFSIAASRITASARSIAVLLNEEEIPAPRGGRWRGCSVPPSCATPSTRGC